MVLRDTDFVNLDHPSWTTVANPKVQGTLNLRHALPNDMGFFLMLGTTSGTLGAYGQSNYAAANSFLPLHTSAVVDIAAGGDVGYVASTKDVAERLERTLSRFMSEADFRYGLHLTLERSADKYTSPPPPTPTTAYQDSAQIILYNELTRPLSDPQNTTSWRCDPRLSIFPKNQDFTAEVVASGSESLRSFLTSLPREPEKLNDPATVAFLAQEIARRVFSFLMKEDVAIDTSQTLMSMGADSLVAIETRNWWKHALAVDIIVLELTHGGHTMEFLGGLAVERLKEKSLHSAG